MKPRSRKRRRQPKRGPTPPRRPSGGETSRTSQTAPTRARGTMGRRPLLTAKALELLEEAYEAGASVKDAAAYAGVGRSTLLAWLARGREEAEAGETAETSPHVELVDRLERARSRGNVEDLKALQRHGRGDARAWRALSYRLAVRDPDEYSEQRRLQVSGSGGPLVFYFPEPETDDEEDAEPSDLEADGDDEQPGEIPHIAKTFGQPPKGTP